MGRGQLKYRARGGRGGHSLGGRGSGGRGGTGGNDDNGTTSSAGVPTRTKRRGGGSHDTSHLPSNTELWGLSFAEDNQEEQGNQREPPLTSVLGSRETERLLNESEWAIGASSWRVASAAPREDDLGEWGATPAAAAAAAASGEFLSLNLDMLEKCLLRIPVHERLRLPLAYTAQLEEVATQEDPALEPAAVLPTSKGGGGGGGVEHLRRVGGGGGGGIEVAVGTGAPNSSREGRDCEIHGGRAVAAVEVAAAATATTADLVEDGEDVVLDALLGLPAAPPVAPVGAANVASDGTGAREYSCTAVVGRPDRGGVRTSSETGLMGCWCSHDDTILRGMKFFDGPSHSSP
ncbi:unnamed protein product [Pylaiella littoralis]